MVDMESWLYYMVGLKKKQFILFPLKLDKETNGSERKIV